MKRLMGLIVLLAGLAVGTAEGSEAVKVLIITGDHGHNWKATTPILKEVLQGAGHKVTVTETPRRDLTSEKLTAYDVLLFNYRDTTDGAKANPESVWTDENKEAFIGAIKGGVGLVVYHHASSAFRGDSPFDKEFEKLSAGGWRNQGFHGAKHQFTVSTRKEHAITRGIKSFRHSVDELYQNSLITEGSDILVTAYSDPAKDPKNTGKHEPMVWINKYGKGRVVQNALGHDSTAMDSVGFKTLMIRCVEWAATGKTMYKAPDQLGK